MVPRVFEQITLPLNWFYWIQFTWWCLRVATIPKSEIKSRKTPDASIPKYIQMSIIVGEQYFLPPIIGGLIIIPTFLAQHATAIIVIEKAKYNIFRNVSDSLVQ